MFNPLAKRPGRGEGGPVDGVGYETIPSRDGEEREDKGNRGILKINLLWWRHLLPAAGGTAIESGECSREVSWRERERERQRRWQEMSVKFIVGGIFRQRQDTESNGQRGEFGRRVLFFCFFFFRAGSVDEHKSSIHTSTCIYLHSKGSLWGQLH